VDMEEYGLDILSYRYTYKSACCKSNFLWFRSMCQRPERML